MWKWLKINRSLIDVGLISFTTGLTNSSQNLYREVHRKGHACYQPIYFNVVLEQMNTAQPAVKITMTGEHIHKPLLDFLKDYIPKLVNVQFGEVFN